MAAIATARNLESNTRHFLEGGEVLVDVADGQPILPQQRV